MIARGSLVLDKALYDAQTEFEITVAPEGYSPLTYLFSDEEYEVMKEASDVDKAVLTAAAFAALAPAYTASTDTWFLSGDGKVIGYVLAEAFTVDGAFTSIGGGDLTRATSIPTLPPAP
jgi:hypothetical protein